MDLEISESSDIALYYVGRDVCLHGYVDSDFAGDVDSRSTWLCFHVGSRVVSWVSRLQKIVALSTTKAEYVAAIKACKKLIWLMIYERACQGTAQ